jgi:pimeloyl-ACP methyl ester carboxylesterase
LVGLAPAGPYPPIPKATLDLIEQHRDDEALPLLDEMAANDTNARWGLQNGVWVYGVDSPTEYVRKTADYTLSDEMIRGIRTPVLILEGEDDKVFEGQAAALARQLQAPHKHVLMRSADGAGVHCHEGAMY